MSIERYSFFVADRTQTVVASDLGKRNSELVQGFQPLYFHRTASCLLRCATPPDAEADPLDPKHAATAVRTIYGQALETFFAFLFAAAQAPRCPLAWLQVYGRKDLCRLVAMVDGGRAAPYLRTAIRGTGWRGLADTLNDLHTDTPEERTHLIVRFGDLWQALSRDLTDEDAYCEYNSLKHGFRAQPGGFSLAIGPDESQLVRMGGSAYGSTIHARQSLPGTPKGSKVFGLREVRHNWDLDHLLARLELIGDSLNNVQSFLRAVGTGSMAEQTFITPDSQDAWDRAAAPSCDVHVFSMGSPVGYEASLEPPSQSGLLEDYRVKLFFGPSPPGTTAPARTVSHNNSV